MSAKEKQALQNLVKAASEVVKRKEQPTGSAGSSGSVTVASGGNGAR